MQKNNISRRTTRCIMPMSGLRGWELPIQKFVSVIPNKDPPFHKYTQVLRINLTDILSLPFEDSHIILLKGSRKFQPNSRCSCIESARRSLLHSALKKVGYNHPEFQILSPNRSKSRVLDMT